MTPQSKLISYRDIEAHFQNLDDEGVVLVGGCFDILHYGHVIFLEEARKEGKKLIVALESDEFIFKKKKRSPVHTQEQRAYVLANLITVDKIINLPLLSGDDDYQALVETIHPSIIAVTDGDLYIEHKTKQANGINAKVKVVTPLIHRLSTNQIIEYASIFSD